MTRHLVFLRFVFGIPPKSRFSNAWVGSHVIVKIQNAITFVRSSPSRQLVFNQCTERLKIRNK